MTIISGREFRANQGKYIDMAHRGERVILSSRKGYMELTPVSKEDKEVSEHISSKSFLSIASQVKKEFKEGKGITLNSSEDIEKWFDSL